MRAVTKHIFIGILIVAFVYIAYESLLPIKQPVYEGFSVKYAKDCTCNPGFIPQKCGDPINMTNERLGGSCIKGTYFCQPTASGNARTSCKFPTNSTTQ